MKRNEEMEEKRKGRPRKNQIAEGVAKAEMCYRSDQGYLDKLRSEKRLEIMKRQLKRPERVVKTGITSAEVNLGAGAANIFEDQAKEDVARKLKEEMSQGKEIKQAFEGAFASLGELGNRDVERLTLVQIETLGRVCRTDVMLDEMIEALEKAGANQRWLDAAKSSFLSGMMEVVRAILKPMGI